MKSFIKNLENRYIGLLIFVVGILMIIFPDLMAKAFPYMLGAGMLLRGIALVILSYRFREESEGPGRVILYWVLGLIIIILGSDAVGIIGVIWAVFTIDEVSADFNAMWKTKHYSVIHIISAIISVSLAVMLILDPFEHFVTHVMVLGLEILFSCLARIVDLIRTGIIKKPDNKSDSKSPEKQ